MAIQSDAMSSELEAVELDAIIEAELEVIAIEVEAEAEEERQRVILEEEEEEEDDMITKIYLYGALILFVLAILIFLCG